MIAGNPFTAKRYLIHDRYPFMVPVLIAWLRGAACRQALADDDTNHFQTFVTSAQMLKFVRIEYDLLVDHFVQLAIINVIGLHVLAFPSLRKK